MSAPHHDHKRPTFLRLGWGLVVSSTLLSIVPLVLYWYSHRRNGLFNVDAQISSHRSVQDEILHLLWSSGPTLLMTIFIVSFISPLALTIFLVAPYAELESGAMGKHCIMANYVIHGMRHRFRLAVTNRKWGLVALVIATFLGSLLDTAASGLITAQSIIVGIHFISFEYSFLLSVS